MRVIVCNIQMFSNDQMVYVFDTETKENIFAQKVNLDNIPDIVCALAHQNGITDVKLHGDLSFNTLIAQEIETQYILNHNYVKLNVEVI